MDPKPVTLIGERVRLEPLTLDHVSQLWAAFAPDPTIWAWWRTDPPANEAAMSAIVAAELKLQDAGLIVAFAQIDLATGRVAGTTRYMDINSRDRHLEIGGTWLGRRWQRSGINTEAKYLLLRHAFEDLGAVRVQLKTDARNRVSQAAIERLGAVREGVLRKHMLSQRHHARERDVQHPRRRMAGGETEFTEQAAGSRLAGTSRIGGKTRPALDPGRRLRGLPIDGFASTRSIVQAPLNSPWSRMNQ